MHHILLMEFLLCALVEPCSGIQAIQTLEPRVSGKRSTNFLSEFIGHDENRVTFTLPWGSWTVFYLLRYNTWDWHWFRVYITCWGMVFFPLRVFSPGLQLKRLFIILSTGGFWAVWHVRGLMEPTVMYPLLNLICSKADHIVQRNMMQDSLLVTQTL